MPLVTVAAGSAATCAWVGRRTGRLWRAVAFVALACALTACAVTTLHREGMELLALGRYQEAIAKLQAAFDQDPQNGQLRIDLLRAREMANNELITQGNSARVAGDFDRAEAAYREALVVLPKDGRAKTLLERLAGDRRRAAAVEEARVLFKKGDLDGAEAHLNAVFLEDPNQGQAIMLQRQIAERRAKEAAAVPELKANFKKPVTLQFRDAGLRMVFESIARTSGINILVDKDIKADQKVSIFVKDTSVDSVLDLLMLQNQLEKKVLSDNTIFVYPNNPAKKKDFQDLQVRSFHLVYAEAKQMQTLLKTLLKTTDMFVNEKTNSLVIRDTPAAIQLAEKMIADQDIADPEVMLEVEVLEVAHTRLQQLGIQYQDSLTLTKPLPGGVSSGGSVGNTQPLTLGDLTKGPLSQLLVSPVPSVTLNWHLDTGDSNILASPRIRARNHEKAKIHIGDRVPVMTNSVTPVATGTPVVTGTVQYLDVGLKLEVEPDIHADGEVGMKVSLEVSNIVNQVTNSVSGSVAYQIGTRTASTVLRLKDGETDVLAGLIDNEDRRTANMIPGLGELPVLGRLFGTHGTNDTKSEIVLAITPRLMGRTKQPEAQNLEYWTGTETTVRSGPFLLKGIGSVDVSANPQAPTPAVRTAPGANTGAGSTGANRGQLGFLWQGPPQAHVGDKITLTLNAQSPNDPLRSLGVSFTYDPAVLKAVDAVQGSFGRGPNSNANFSRDVGSGSVNINLEDTSGQGARGPGSVAAITFEVVGEGSTQVSVGQVVPTGLGGDSVGFTPPPPFSITTHAGAAPAPGPASSPAAQAQGPENAGGAPAQSPENAGAAPAQSPAGPTAVPLPEAGAKQ